MDETFLQFRHKNFQQCCLKEDIAPLNIPRESFEKCGDKDAWTAAFSDG
jgi:hypothetical protein